jgi:hypothetical protein
MRDVLDLADMPQFDRDAEYDEFFSASRGRPPLKSRGMWGYRKVTFCGVTRSLKEWIKESGIREATVYDRVVIRGQDPVQALTTPDREGNCLKPLTAEYLESHRKAQQRARSGAISVGNAGGYTHAAGIMAHGRKIFLGTFNSWKEAAFAFNRAVDLLPGEYDPSDKYEDVSLDLLTRVRIETSVRERFEAAGLEGELESECCDE